MTARIPAEPDEDVYWEIPTGPDYDAVCADIEDQYDTLWQNPTDGWARTRTVLEADDTLLLALYRGETLIGYDATVPLPAEREQQLYANSLADLTVSRADQDRDPAMVYHLVVDAAKRGNGYGLGTAFIRQSLLEQDWETDPQTVYDRMVAANPAISRYDGFEDVVATATDEITVPTPEAILSVPRLYETDADYQQGNLSRSYRISRGFGFEETAIRNQRQAVMQKTLGTGDQ